MGVNQENTHLKTITALFCDQVEANETVQIVTDDGDVWLLCAKMDGSGRQGYVPTSYAEK